MVADAVNATGSSHDYPHVPECNLSSNLDTLLEQGTFSDVTLAVGDKEFPAHKAILAGVCVCEGSPGSEAVEPQPTEPIAAVWSGWGVGLYSFVVK